VPRASILPGYSTAEVARLVGLSQQKVRSYVKSGFLEPRRGPRDEYRFSFQDLVVLRTARDLVKNRVPARRIRKALATLSKRLPRGRSLAELRIAAEGGEVVVREDGEAWNPESGQLVLDFRVAELARRAGALAPAMIEKVGSSESPTAEDWCDLGLELEASAPSEAAEAYRRCLVIEPGHADAHLNLGRLYHEEGRLKMAEEHYRQALILRPHDATAAFNLGVAYQDAGRLEEALSAYRRAVDADSNTADAYFNMSGIYEELGKRATAFQNLRIYKKLTE